MKYHWIDSKTLVFDMDETLIHCNESTEIPCDVVVDIKFPTGERIQVSIQELSCFVWLKKKVFFGENLTFYE